LTASVRLFSFQKAGKRDGIIVFGIFGSEQKLPADHKPV
jgi:hypothetical protein